MPSGHQTASSEARSPVCIIFNPAARGEKAKRFQQYLATITSACALKPTSAPGDGRALAAAAVREGFQTIVAAGGDGTVNEVLNGMGDEPDGFARVRLGVLPLGTVNVFAKELDLPANFPAAWKIIQEGREMTIDLPEVEFSVDGKIQRRFFAQMAGAGLDSRAVEFVKWEHKKMFGGLAYVIAGLKALRGPMPQITATDGNVSMTGELVLIGNGRYYGGKFSAFPSADLRDGVLEVSVFPRANWLGILRTGLGLLTGRLYTVGGVRHFKAASFHLHSNTPVPFHVEGENIGSLPAKFSVRRQALRVIVPEYVIRGP